MLIPLRRTVTHAAVGALALSGLVLYAQHDHQSHAAMSASPEKQELAVTEDAMSGMHGGHHHEAGPHMRMSTLQPQSVADVERAQKIVDEGRAALEHYKDFKVAEDEGFRIFLPNLKQKMYHFTNFQYAIEAGFRFNPSHPTSLLYEKTGENSYKLIGAMYTAPQRFSEQQLNERIPLSVAQWHQHVNLCVPPRERRAEMMAPNPRFGLMGSIATQSECESAGGTFKPVVFGWMVHFYPYEKSMDQIWSVERQLASAEHQH